MALAMRSLPRRSGLLCATSDEPARRANRSATAAHKPRPTCRERAPRSAAALIREVQLDGKQSLGGLLRSIRAHAAEYSRDDYYRLWKQLPDGDEHGTFRRWAGDAFDQFAGPGSAHVDPAIVDAVWIHGRRRAPTSTAGPTRTSRILAGSSR